VETHYSKQWDCQKSKMGYLIYCSTILISSHQLLQSKEANFLMTINEAQLFQNQ